MAAREGVLSSAGTDAARETGAPRSWYRDAEGGVHRDLPPRELMQAARAAGGTLWVDIDSTSRHQIALLEKVFEFHHLAIEDTLNPNSRVKLEEYPGYLFLIVRGVRFQEETDDPYDLETFNLCFFLGAGYVVTVHGEHAESVHAVAERIAASPDVLERGPGRLMHAIVDASVDAYFPIVDRIDDFVDGLEERIFQQFDESALRDIFSVKRLVLSLRRHLAPQREIFNVLTNRPSTLLAPETQLYYRDVYDHVLRINDSLEAFRELLGSTMDSYLTQVSNRLGHSTKGLTGVATITIPFVVISGMWGMNFSRIPLADHPLGFWILLGGQLAIGVLLLVVLRLLRFL
ncbi:MAG TPA: magnesium transporter CorA family protein [Gemmatimonadaceae bacterium]